MNHENVTIQQSTRGGGLNLKVTQKSYLRAV